MVKKEPGSGHRRRLSGIVSVRAFLSLALLLYAGNYFAADLKALVDGHLLGDTSARQTLHGWSLLVHTVLLFVAVAWARRLAQGFLVPRTRGLEDMDDPPMREVLVVYLSKLPPDPQSPGRLAGDGLPTHAAGELTFRLDEDLRMLADKKRAAQGRLPNWSWEQPLRGIRHHLKADGTGALQRLVIVGSKESLPQVHVFCNSVLRKYRELDAVRVQAFCRREKFWQLVDCSPEPVSGEGLDFEAFDSQSTALRELLRLLRMDGCRDTDIVIDLTGGMKPTSVVAAAMTFNTDIRTQYVRTQPRIESAGDGRWHYDVIGYDLMLEQPGIDDVS